MPLILNDNPDNHLNASSAAGALTSVIYFINHFIVL
jgi:hypothetical protein